MAKILMVLSGVDYWTLKDGTRHPSGYWAEEFVTPHRVLTEAGMRVEIAAPAGGRPTPDPVSLSAENTGGEAAEFIAYIDGLADELAAPKPLHEVDVAEYDAVFIPGGHGPMEDLAHDPDLGRILIDADAAGKVIAPVCHGPAALLSANLPGGRWLFEGRTLTVFTDEEERLNGTADKAPWLVETVMAARGAKISSIEAWGENIVADGNLLTGQNPASSRALAERVVDAIAAG